MAVITVHLDIVSAEAEIFSGLVEMVSVTGEEGELGIMAGHTALLTSIKPGEARITLQGGKKELFYISGGMLEVQPNCITILADTVVRAENLDEAEAVQAKEQAEQQLADKKISIDQAKVMLELAQAAAKLRIIRDLKRRKR